MKILMLICFVVTELSSKTLNYKFKINKGKPELQVTKSTKVRKKHSKRKLRTKPLTDMEMIKLNPTMAPMIALGDILKEFTKTMQQKKSHKKKKHKKRKLKVVKSEPKKDIQPQETPNVQDRKTFIGGMGAGASTALIGGGLAAGVGAGMAMGAAQNEGLEHEIGLKENELGIMKIREKVDDDINQELFSSGIKLKGLREKAKTVLANGEAAIMQVESSLDNTLGDLMAMDHQLSKHLNG
jgi:hypothetical protein